MTLDPTDEHLQAESFTLQKQTNLVFYAFGIWHSKTRVSRGLSSGEWGPNEHPRLFQSLPALRFNASHLKKKYWSVWRNAMPQVLQSKKAREFGRNALLSAHRVDLAPCPVDEITFVQAKSSKNGRKHIGRRWH